MHLLNALPQRLDPGATPTFAGLISATLTAPASTNLTLTSGLVGTNKVNFPDTLTASSSTAGAVTIGNGTAATNVAIGGGKVNIGNTTAGSSGAGALVVAGGLATGAASYFGGAVTVNGAGSFTTADATQTFRIKGATGMLRFAGYVDAANGTVLYSLNNAENAYIPLSVNSSEIFLNIAGTPKLSIGTTGAATFAGAVTVGGNLTVNGGTTASGQIGLNGTHGVEIWGKAGTTSSFILYNNAGAAVLTNAINTTTATFAGAVTVTGALKLGNAYVGTPVVGTGYIVIQDSNGTDYKVSVSL